MKKGVLFILLAVTLVLIVSSCQRVPQGETPTETSSAARIASSGTRGVEILPLPNFPPTTVYDQNELVAVLEVRNRGSHTIQPQSCFVQISGFDPNIIKGNFHIPRSCTDTLGGPLEGKNLYNAQGGINQLEFRSDDISLPPSVPFHETTLNYMSCYNYHTTASPTICVDPLFYQITSEQKSCTPRDVSGGGGQGGPVGVSYVNVDMVGSKAIFEITIRNFGSGKVLNPQTDIRTCGLGGLNKYSDMNKVAYNVQMLGGSLNDCKPHDGFVRLNNNQGKIICSYNIAGTSTYETPLIVDLDYNYIQSSKRSLRIIKTPS